MKLNEIIKNNKILIIIILIFIYHYLIQNDLEKRFSQVYFEYTNIKRPTKKCEKNTKNLNCVGMPSGHAESVTILSSLLYLYKFIPLWLCLLVIFVFSIQRIIKNKHSIDQVLMGIIIGLFYVFIYKKLNLSIYAFIIVLLIGFTLLLLTYYKLNNQISMK